MNDSPVYRLVRVNEDEYDLFAQSQPNANFLQSPGIARRRVESGWSSDFWALKNKANEIVAAALLQKYPIGLGYYTVECQEGPLLDYGDQDIFRIFLHELKHQLRNIKAASLRVNPPIAQNIYNEQLQLTSRPEFAVRATKELTAAGFQHLPPTVTDKNPALLRWYFVKDLTDSPSIDELMKSFDQQTRWSINKAHKFGVQVRVLDERKDTPRFYEVIKTTSERLGFEARSISYYESLFDSFSREQAIFTEAYLDVAEYKHNLEIQLQQQQELLATLDPNDKKLTGRRNEAAGQIATYQKKLQDIPALAGNKSELPLAAAMFMRYGSELVYFSSGSNEQYKSFNGAYALQYWAIQYALDHGVTRYNFYGTNGTYNGHPEQDGVWQFKRGFGGALEEQPGYFVYTPLPHIVLLHKVASRVLRKIKHLARR